MKGGRTLLFGGLAVVLVTACWWIIGSDRNAAPANVEGGRTELRSSDALIPAPIPATPAASPERAAVPVVPDEASRLTTNAATTVAVEIHLTVVDGAGAKHPDENGRLTVLVITDLDEDTLVHWFLPEEALAIPGQWPAIGTPTTVEVRSGHCVVHAPKSGWLALGDVELGARPTMFRHPRLVFRVPENRQLDLKALWQKPLTLHVRDADSGTELGEVEVGAAKRVVIDLTDGQSLFSASDSRSIDSANLAHPGRADAVVAFIHDATSPIPITLNQVPEECSQRTVFVRASGYAWQRVLVDFDVTGDREVLLHKAGQLEVSIIGNARDPGMVLRVRTTEAPRGIDHDLLTAVRLEDRDRIVLESVPIGHYWLRAELGENWYRNPEILAVASVDVTPGAHVVAELVLPQQQAPKRVPFAGTVHLPKAWNATSLTVDAEFAGTVHGGVTSSFKTQCKAPNGAGDEAWHFDAGACEPGQYDIEIEPVHYSVVVELPDAGLLAADIDVPEPAFVAVRVVDDDTDLDVGPDDVKVRWWCEKPNDWTRSWSSPGAIWNPNTQRHEFTACVAPIHFDVEAKDYANEAQDVALAAGRNELTARLRRKSSIVVHLHDGDSPVPWSSEYREDTDPLEGQPHRLYSTYGSELEIVMAAPGRYRLKISGITGYLPIPDREVVIEKGKTTDVAIALEHKP